MVIKHLFDIKEDGCKYELSIIPGINKTKDIFYYNCFEELFHCLINHHHLYEESKFTLNNPDDLRVFHPTQKWDIETFIDMHNKLAGIKQILS